MSYISNVWIELIIPFEIILIWFFKPKKKTFVRQVHAFVHDYMSCTQSKTEAIKNIINKVLKHFVVFGLKASTSYCKTYIIILASL